MFTQIDIENIQSKPSINELSERFFQLGHEHEISDEIFTRGKLQFDRLYKETEENIKIMAISVHPYLTGVPHRIGFFEKLLDYVLEHDDVEIMTGRDIYNWYTEQVPKNS